MRRKPVSIAWDNKYTRPPAWETEEPGIWASILQELPEKPSSLSVQQERLHPWPVATMELQGKTFKVHATRVVEGSGKPGEILGLTKTGLRIACGEGAVEIISLQAEGGKRMAAPDYFRGHPLEH